LRRKKKKIDNVVMISDDDDAYLWFMQERRPKLGSAVPYTDGQKSHHPGVW
jgi:hypothetical protein